MKSDIALVQGDNKPDLNITIKKANGDPVDISTATINFYFRKKGSATVVNTSHTGCTVTDGPNGKCTYEWDNHAPITPLDLAGEGDHEGEVEITFATGDIQTVPAIIKLFVRGEFK